MISSGIARLNSMSGHCANAVQQADAHRNTPWPGITLLFTSDNAGTARIHRNVHTGGNHVETLVAIAGRPTIDLTLVGPEESQVGGIACGMLKEAGPALQQSMLALELGAAGAAAAMEERRRIRCIFRANKPLVPVQIDH